MRRKLDGAAPAKGKGAGRAASATERAEETAARTRHRLQDALQNRDLLKSIGEYEEYLPLSTRVVRELRAIFECLGGMPSDGSRLLLVRPPPPSKGGVPPPPVAPEPAMPPGGKVLRTEKVGSGSYTSYTTLALKTGYPHLDAYGEARRSVAYASGTSTSLHGFRTCFVITHFGCSLRDPKSMDIVGSSGTLAKSSSRPGRRQGSPSQPAPRPSKRPPATPCG